MEALKPRDIELLVEKIVRFLRQENVYVSSCEIREKALKYEIYLKLDNNAMGISAIKLIFNKNKSQYRVFTGRTGLDLRLKRFIQRESSKMAGNHETASQETDTGSGGFAKRTGKVV